MPLDHPGHPVASAWDASLDVSHARMDQEHKDLFTLFQRFEALASDTRANQDELRDIITEFISMASKHFIFEERLMVDVDYPWSQAKPHMDDHMVVQARFLKVIGPVVRHSLDWEAARKGFFDVFISHIIAYDAPLANYIRELESSQE